MYHYSNTFTFTPEKEGNYTAYVSAYNEIEPHVDGNAPVIFNVYDSKPQTAPVVSMSKTTLAVNETALLTWTESPDTEYYWVYCYNDYGEYISADGGTEFAFTVFFPAAGTYHITVSACNAYGFTPGNEVTINVGINTVTLDSNGGVCGIPAITAYLGEPYGVLPIPTRTGYTFDGWYTAASGGTIVTENTTVTVTADHTLYAHWKKTFILGDADGDGEISLKDVVQITRYLAGGWDVTVDPAVADVNHDGEVNLKDAVILRRYLAGGWGIELK